MMGDGAVIFPTEGAVYAPMDCEVVFVFPSKHAIGLKADNDLEALIHVGLDTVNLDGKGFNVLVKDGDRVKRGDKLMEFDLEFIRENATDIATPVIVTNLPDNQTIEMMQSDTINVGDALFKVK